MFWALVIVLTANTSGIPDRIVFVESRAACERQAPVEVHHLETTGRAVQSATCSAIRRDGRAGRG